jgi:hypothetical protein
MPTKVSKNGTDFFDIDDSPESLDAAKSKGYQEYVPVTKNGKDVFNIVATDDSLKAAFDKGYKDPGMFAFQQKDPNAGISKIDSTYKGAIQGASQNFGDELAGGLDAVGHVVGVHGLGSAPLNEIRGETSDEAGKGYGDTYRAGRDAVRGENSAAEAANPKSYMAGNIGGGIALGGPLGGASLKGAMALGAVGGLGGSDADLTQGDVMGAARDTALGAAGGAAGYGLGKAVGAVATKAGRQGLQDTAQAFSRGADNAEGGLIPKVNELIGGLKEIKVAAAAKDEFQKVASVARSVLHPGQAGTAGHFTDDEAVLAALMQDGENPVKQWYAQKSAMLNPGAHSSEDYSKVLNMDSGARQTARAFNPREAAKELRPDIEEVQGLFKRARGERFGQLQDQARQAFDSNHVQPVVDDVEQAISDAGNLKSVPSSVSSLLADVHGMITEGKGTKLQGLTPGGLGDVDAGEHFNRLQKARELLDSKIKWASREGEGQSEGLLRSVRDSIDTALKTSPDKVEADALYRGTKDLEGRFFGATEFRNPSGGVDVDEGKIARLLGNTDQANRFKASLADIKELAQRPDLSPEFRQKAQETVAKIESKMGIADDQRAISSLRYKQGPSSPAIERLQSAQGKNSLLKDAVNAPAGFLNSTDEFSKFVKTRTGSAFQDLSPQAKLGAAKFRIWLNKNPDASPALIDATWTKLVKP